MILSPGKTSEAEQDLDIWHEEAKLKKSFTVSPLVVSRGKTKSTIYKIVSWLKMLIILEQESNKNECVYKLFFFFG